MIVAWLFIIALIGGVVYFSVQVSQDKQSKDQLVKRAEHLAQGHESAEEVLARLQDARTKAENEVERLQFFTDSPSSSFALASFEEYNYEQVAGSVAKKIDFVFDNRKVSVSNDTSVQTRIATDRRQINEVLAKWKALVNNQTPATNPSSVQSTAATYAAEIKSYIFDLQNIVASLTPENSGLTAEEIIAYRNTVAETINDINQALSNISQTTVPPVVVQEQQQIVQQAQQQVSNIEDELIQITTPFAPVIDPLAPDNSNGNNPNNPPVNNAPPADPSAAAADPVIQNPSSGPSGPPGSRFIPPLPVQDPSKPKLIEGANPTI